MRREGRRTGSLRVYPVAFGRERGVTAHVQRCRPRGPAPPAASDAGGRFSCGTRTNRAHDATITEIFGHLKIFWAQPRMCARTPAGLETLAPPHFFLSPRWRSAAPRILEKKKKFYVSPKGFSRFTKKQRRGEDKQAPPVSFATSFSHRLSQENLSSARADRSAPPRQKGARHTAHQKTRGKKKKK
jgi:hypothetical protein